MLNACTSNVLHYFQGVLMYFIITKILAYPQLLYLTPAVPIPLVNLSPYSSAIQRAISRVPTSEEVSKILLSVLMVSQTFQYPCFTSSLEMTVEPHHFFYSKVGIGWCFLFDSFYSSTMDLSK